MPANTARRLRPDAEQLLKAVAEMREAERYEGSYTIDDELLKKLGFSSVAFLDEAVRFLNVHAHYYGGFWEGSPPWVYTEEGRLVACSAFEDAWRMYQAAEETKQV